MVLRPRFVLHCKLLGWTPSRRNGISLLLWLSLRPQVQNAMQIRMIPKGTNVLKVIEKVQAKERTKVEARALHPKVKTALLKANRFVLSLMILKRDAV